MKTPSLTCIICTAVLVFGSLVSCRQNISERNESQEPEYDVETSTYSGDFDDYTLLSAYTSRDFGIMYPSFMDCEFLSENGDGLAMRYDSRNYMEVFGEWIFDDSVTIEKLYAEELKSPMGSISYKLKKINWFVMSGYTPEGCIYYKKTAITTEGAIAVAQLVFEPKNKEVFEPIIPKIFGNFPLK